MTFPTEISSPPQVSAEVVLNENFETLEHQAVYGKKHATTSALTWGYFGGRWAGFAVSDGTLTLSNSTTNHLVVARGTGVISTSTASTNWDNVASYARVYKLTTAGGVVTSEEDHRAGTDGVHGTASVGSISGGSVTSLTTFSLRDTSAAYNVTIAAASNTALTAGRTLTLNMQNVAHTIKLGSTEGTITFPDAATMTVARADAAQTFTGTQTVIAAATQDGVALAGRAGGTSSYVATIMPPTLAGNIIIALPATSVTLNDGSALTGAAISLSGGTTQTAFENATVQLNIGGTGATSVVNIPGTKGGTSSTSAAVTLNSLGVAENAFIGGTLMITATSPQLTLGVLNTTSGGILSYGSTSGSQTWKPPAAAGAGIIITFPATSVTLNAAGDLTGTTLNGGVVTSSLTTVGALNAGSITSGFGSIDVGTDAISGGVFTGAVSQSSIYRNSLSNALADTVTNQVDLRIGQGTNLNDVYLGINAGGASNAFLDIRTTASIFVLQFGGGTLATFTPSTMALTGTIGATAGIYPGSTQTTASVISQASSGAGTTTTYIGNKSILVSNGINFGPSSVTSITVVNGQITAIS